MFGIMLIYVFIYVGNNCYFGSVRMGGCRLLFVRVNMSTLKMDPVENRCVTCTGTIGALYSAT